MGGAGPYVEFRREGTSEWSARTGIRTLSDTEREEVYERAKPFLLQYMQEILALKNDRGELKWVQDDVVDFKGFPVLFVITSRNSGPNKSRLVLPRSFSSLFRDDIDLSKEIVPRAFFDGNRLNRNNSTLFIDSPRPMADIFYLLQVLAPGAFLICREEEYDEIGEEECTRALPDPSWVEKNRTLLEEVLGGTEEFLTILDAARNKSFHNKWLVTYDYDRYGSDEPGDDFAACSMEDCGWCGRCYY